MAADRDGMHFEPSMEVRMLKDQIDEFIRQEVQPLEEENDQFLGEDAEFHKADDNYELVDEYLDIRRGIQKRSAEAGFYTMHMPEDVGGGGLSALAFTQLLEHIYDRNPEGFHGHMIDMGCVNPSLLVLAEDEYQREEYFEPLMSADRVLTFGLTEPDHGSDATWMDTTAEQDGDEWVINGTKCFSSRSPYADFIMVHARTSGDDGDVEGISTFLVDEENPGWEKGKVQRGMGGDPGMHQFNHFTDCRVPDRKLVGEEGQGLQSAMKWVGETRLYHPAMQVGRSQWMFDQCVDYANQRETFGKPIGRRQLVQQMLAEMRLQIEQVRWFYRQTAWEQDRGEGERWKQSAVKLQGARMWNDVADKAIQIHGGAGYMRSLPFEGEYRRARAGRIYEGTDEIQIRTIARQLLKGVG